MKALRKQEVSIQAAGEFKVGDQIEIGKYTATCQKVTKKGALFLLDQYLDEPFKMNRENTNEGGYEASDLRTELQKNSVLAIFESVRNMMVPFKNGDLLRIPYAEEFFGDVDGYESSGKKQWPLMTDRKNRIAIREGEAYEWGWLQNKLEFSSAYFACELLWLCELPRRLGLSRGSSGISVRLISAPCGRFYIFAHLTNKSKMKRRKIMKVARKVQFKTNEICVGDQINVKLHGFGRFTATAQKVTDKGILFLFDEVVARHPMNESNINKGGFDGSDMKRWLNEVVLRAFPDKLRNKVTEITLPTYGEVFGHDDFYENFEPDNDEQFEMMKRRGNRVCDFEDDWCWWWLRNATKESVSSAYFAGVGASGYTGYGNASNSGGVRPEFWLVR